MYGELITGSLVVALKNLFKSKSTRKEVLMELPALEAEQEKEQKIKHRLELDENNMPKLYLGNTNLEIYFDEESEIEIPPLSEYTQEALTTPTESEEISPLAYLF